MSGSARRDHSGHGDGDSDDNSDGRPSRKRAKLHGEYTASIEQPNAAASTECHLSCFECLPSDVHAHVLSFLPAPGAFALEVTSRKMKNVIDNYVCQLKEVDLRVGAEGIERSITPQLPSVRGMRWLKQRVGALLEYLILPALPQDDESVQSTISQFESYHLRRLKLKFSHEKFFSACHSIPFALTQLDLVVFSKEGTVTLLEQLCNVKSLHLRSPYMPEQGMLDLEIPASCGPQNLPRLETLSLTSVYLRGPAESAPAFLTDPSRIKSLFLNSAKLPDALFLEHGFKFTALEVVHLRRCDLRTQVFVSTQQSNLASLAIISCPNIQSEVMPYILTSPKLERLDIGLTFVDQQIFTPPGPFPTLKYVRFGPLEPAQNGAFVPAPQVQQNVVVFTYGSVALLDAHFPNLLSLHLMSKVWVVFPTPGADGSPSVLFSNLTSLKMMDVMDGACVAGFVAYCPQLKRIECNTLTGDVLLASQSLEFFAMRSGDAFIQVRHCPSLRELEIAQLRNINLVGPCEELTALRVAHTVVSWGPHSASLLALSASLSGLPKLSRLEFSELAVSAPIADLAVSLQAWVISVGATKTSIDASEDYELNSVSSFAEAVFLPSINTWLSSSQPFDLSAPKPEFIRQELIVSDGHTLFLSHNLTVPENVITWFEWCTTSAPSETLSYKRNRLILRDSPNALAAEFAQSLSQVPRPRPLRHQSLDRCLLVVYNAI